MAVSREGMADDSKGVTYRWTDPSAINEYPGAEIVGLDSRRALGDAPAA